MNLGERLKTLFKTWLAPLVNLETTLLLFATFVFYHHYFGAVHPATDLLIQHGALWAVYIYGAVVLLASLVRIPEDWQPITESMVYLGSALISILYTVLFWVRPSRPSWQELLVQVYYVLQAAIALIQVILLIMQEPGAKFAVTP